MAELQLKKFAIDWSDISDEKLESNLKELIKNYKSYPITKLDDSGAYLIGSNVVIHRHSKGNCYVDGYIINGKDVHELHLELAALLYMNCKEVVENKGKTLVFNPNDWEKITDLDRLERLQYLKNHYSEYEVVPYRDDQSLGIGNVRMHPEHTDRGLLTGFKVNDFMVSSEDFSLCWYAAFELFDEGYGFSKLLPGKQKVPEKVPSKKEIGFCGKSNESYFGKESRPYGIYGDWSRLSADDVRRNLMYLIENKGRGLAYDKKSSIRYILFDTIKIEYIQSPYGPWSGYMINGREIRDENLDLAALLYFCCDKAVYESLLSKEFPRPYKTSWQHQTYLRRLESLVYLATYYGKYDIKLYDDESIDISGITVAPEKDGYRINGYLFNKDYRYLSYARMLYFRAKSNVLMEMNRQNNNFKELVRSDRQIGD